MSGRLIGVAKNANDFAITTSMMLEKGIPIIVFNSVSYDTLRFIECNKAKETPGVLTRILG